MGKFKLMTEISIHAPTRGATELRIAKRIKGGISIHAPTRGATDSTYKLDGLNYISIHAPTRGATFLRLSGLPTALYFNPRSHERSDIKAFFAVLAFIISIHAPTRGATISQIIVKFFALISIHAPTRGATAILHKKFVYFYTIPTINI